MNWSLFVAAARPAARRFVQDAQSVMRLAESGVETRRDEVETHFQAVA